jgi:integrase
VQCHSGSAYSKPIAGVTRRDVEELVQKLDEKVQAGKRFAWKTAVNCWAVTTRMFSDARRSKRLDLRVREDNPTLDVEGPDRGADKSKGFVYPSEFLTLVRAPDDVVPLLWKRLAAVAVYLGVRAGELEALEWEDIDLEHSKVTVHRAIDRDPDPDAEADATKCVKDQDPRPFGIEPALLPLFRVMHCEAGGKGRVFPDFPRHRGLAEGLRDYLRAAGVTRAELFISDKTRINIRFHDLRASTVTWMAVRGDTAERIIQRVGHEDWPTMKKYMRTAEALVEGFGEVFPPLPFELLETPANRSAIDPQIRKSSKVLRGGRDLNPRPPA